MSERKVLTKYYPPDFDPAALARRSHKPKNAGPPLQLVRLMAPVSMRCTKCGEYIYKGRKFNARKETPAEGYLGVQIFRFYIRCTRCSAEIIFRTDPKNRDYEVVSGAKRNVEPWHKREEETDEQRLDRLEAEEAAEAGEAVSEQNRMEELEAKTLEAKREMDVADALDEIRTRNARIARADHRDHLEAVALARPTDEAERLRQQDLEDELAARQAFAARRKADMDIVVEVLGDDAGAGATDSTLTDTATAATAPSMSSASSSSSSSRSNSSALMPPPPLPSQPSLAAESAPVPAPEIASAPVPSFKRQIKKKKDHSALLGIKKKPSLV